MKKQKQCEHCSAKGELRKDLPRAKTLCDDCYEYFYAQDFVKPIKED